MAVRVPAADGDGAGAGGFRVRHPEADRGGAAGVARGREGAAAERAAEADEEGRACGEEFGGAERGGDEPVRRPAGGAGADRESTRRAALCSVPRFKSARDGDGKAVDDGRDGRDQRRWRSEAQALWRGIPGGDPGAGVKGWRALGGLAVLAALCACDGEPREGVYRYGCYTGLLADTYVTVTWSDAGRRADAVIDGRAYVFREAGGGGGFFDFIEVYKDGGATL